MWTKLFIFIFIVLNSASSQALEEQTTPNFKEVLEIKKFDFPKDHGSHPAYKTEWWYFTGHLEDFQKKTFGFELTFFRIGVNPEGNLKSNWAIGSIYLGHFAITDDENNSFYHSEIVSRDNFEKAGSSESKLNVWIDNWNATFENNIISINAKSGETSLNLKLTPFKEIVLQGEKGLSKKGPKDGQASFYTSFTNLRGNGEIEIKDKVYKIETVKAWMDHEITSSNMAYGVEGWDWFAIQLEDDSELMIYQLRDKNNNPTKFSSGTIIYPNGTTKKLGFNEFTISSTSTWKSQKTGITYPQNWQVNIPKEGIQLKVLPTVKNQELIASDSTKNTYWEGRSKVTGKIKGKNINGNAYVELVGY